jgi:hypothetical protein
MSVSSALEAQYMFKRMPWLEFEQLPPKRLRQAMMALIRPQVESSRFIPDLVKLKAVPIEVETFYWLQRFRDEAEGNGISTFILNDSISATRQTLESLRRVGADELARRLEAAIPLAIDSHAEFTRNGVPAWSRQFPRNPEFPDLRSVDAGAVVLYEELRKRLIDYIAEHQSDFVE